MRASRHDHGLVRATVASWLVAICGICGCHSPATRVCDNGLPGVVGLADSASSVEISKPGEAVIVESPRGQFSSTLIATPSQIETWVVHTRACDQRLGSDPWSSFTIGRLDEQGGPLHGAEPEALLGRMSGRPSIVFIHGAGYTYKDAVDEAVKIREVLEGNGGLTPESIFIIFDWPSERERGDFIQDLNEQSRRSRVAAYHFARFLQTAPASSRICMMGQSNGGRIVLTTMHLLAGGPLRPFWTEPEVQLTSGRPDLRLRAVVLDTAAGHHWLNPGERLEQALPGCEGLLNLRNCADYALSVYMLGVYTGLRPALGQVGLLPYDLRSLGPLAARVEQINLHSRVGFSHTNFPQALGLPDIADRIAVYTSWSNMSSPAVRPTFSQ